MAQGFAKQNARRQTGVFCTIGRLSIDIEDRMLVFFPLIVVNPDLFVNF
jgi:hypothetical protein